MYYIYILWPFYCVIIRIRAFYCHILSRALPHTAAQSMHIATAHGHAAVHYYTAARCHTLPPTAAFMCAHCCTLLKPHIAVCTAIHYN
jgi:Na+/proline symporter